MTNEELADECERVTGATWMSTAHGPVYGCLRIARVKGSFLAICSHERGDGVSGYGCSVRAALSDLSGEIGAQMDRLSEGRRTLSYLLRRPSR